MKKVIIGVIILVIALGSVDPYASYMADQGFNEKNPDKSMKAAMIKRRMFNFVPAIAIYRKIIEKYPDYKELDACYYYMALCYEKAGKIEDSIKAYEEFDVKFPKSSFHAIAVKRLSNIKANQTSE
jgi:tetratricopeptide (TPR) repeat protein